MTKAEAEADVLAAGASAAASIRWRRWRRADVLRRLGVMHERGELTDEQHEAARTALQESADRRGQ